MSEQEIQSVEEVAREYWDQKARKPQKDMGFDARLEEAHLRAVRLQRVMEALAATEPGTPVRLSG